METRPYFVLGDVFANALAGTIVGLAMAALFGPGWNMILAMFVGMAIGMLISMPIAFPLGALFGAMEVMVPVMTTGMVAGMVVSMAAAMAPETAVQSVAGIPVEARGLSLARGAELGLYSGLATILACYAANAWIRGRASRWTS